MKVNQYPNTTRYIRSIHRANVCLFINYKVATESLTLLFTKYIRYNKPHALPCVLRIKI